MNRVISCYSNAFGPAGVHTAAQALAEIGLGQIELALKPHDFGGLVIPESVLVTERTDPATVTEFLAFLGACHVEVSGCNVGGGDLRTGEGFEITASRMRFASRTFGARLAVGAASQPTNPAERAVVIDHLKQLGDLAESLGMNLSLETHKGPTQNAGAMLALMAEVDHPRVGLNFDTGNIAYYNAGADPVTELDRVKHLVRSVHLKDNRGGFEDWYFPAFGDGNAVDFRRIREILDDVGFNGPYTIEIEGIGGEPEPGLDARRDRVARSVEHLHSSGYFD
jgi:L-ribulose-5-phosphate 3-epimerase